VADNRSVELILSRLASQPRLTPKGVVDPHPVWSQDVVNEVAAELADLPSGWQPTCHLKDTACQQKRRSLSTQEASAAKRRWWLARTSHSKWLASHQAASCASPSAGAKSEQSQQLVAWTELRVARDAARQPAVQPHPTLAALPRAVVGRMCGKRQSVDPSWFAGLAPLPCSFYEGLPLQQQVTHMQFTNAETRVNILEAMHWWYLPTAEITAAPAPGSAAATSATAATSTSCASLAQGTGPTSPMAAVVVSSAMYNSSLLCVLPGRRSGQQASLLRGDCPCCWQIAELRKAAMSKVALLGGTGKLERQSGKTGSAAALKVLKRASAYTGCRIWRRFV